MANRFCVGTTFLAFLLSLASAVRWLSTQPFSTPLRPFLASGRLVQWKRSTTARVEGILNNETVTILNLAYILISAFAGSIVIVALGNLYLIWRARNNPIIQGPTSRLRSTGSPTERTSLLSGSDGSSYSAGSEPWDGPLATVDPHRIANRPEFENTLEIPIRARMHSNNMTYAEAMAYIINEPENVELPVTGLPLRLQPQTLDATVTECVPEPEPLKSDDDEPLLPSGSLTPIAEETPLLTSHAAFVLTHITYDRSSRAPPEEETPESHEATANDTLDTPDASPDITTPSVDDHAVPPVAQVAESPHSRKTLERSGTDVGESTPGVAVSTGESDNDDDRDLLCISPPPCTPLPAYNEYASSPPSYVYGFAPLHPDAEQRLRRIVLSQSTIDQDGMVTGLRRLVHWTEIINMDIYNQRISDGVPAGLALYEALIPGTAGLPGRQSPLSVLIAGATTYTRPTDTVPFPIALASRSGPDTNSDRNSLFLSSDESSDGGSNRLSRSSDEHPVIPHERRQRRLAMSLRDHQIPHIGPRPSQQPIIVRSARVRQTSGTGPADGRAVSGIGMTGTAAPDDASQSTEVSSDPLALEDPAVSGALSDVETVYVNGNNNYSSTPRVESDSQLAGGQEGSAPQAEVEAAQVPISSDASRSLNVASEPDVHPVTVTALTQVGTIRVNGNSDLSHSSSVASNAHQGPAGVSDEDATPMAAPIPLPSLPMVNGDHPTVAPVRRVSYHHPPWLHQDNTTSWSDSSDENPASGSSDEASHHGSSSDNTQGHGINGDGNDADWSHSSDGSAGEQSSLDEPDPRRDTGIA